MDTILGVGRSVVLTVPYLHLLDSQRQQFLIDAAQVGGVLLTLVMYIDVAC